jgi:alpha-1,3-rhamnosyl/mannosyltransferase
VDHPEGNTHVIHVGIDHSVFRPEGPSESGGPYLVSVGVIEPRKNLVRALSAFERLAKAHEGLRWKIVGRKGWGWGEFEAALGASAVRDRVDLLGVLSDEELAKLYRGARALLYPSLWEGFGIPVVEALACGTAVAASRLPAIEEVGGDAVVPLDPADTVSIAEAAERAAFDELGREQRRKRGIEQANRFNWQRAADQHLDVYAQALDVAVVDLRPSEAGAP